MFTRGIKCVSENICVYMHTKKLIKNNVNYEHLLQPPETHRIKDKVIFARHRLTFPLVLISNFQAGCIQK